MQVPLHLLAASQLISPYPSSVRHRDHLQHGDTRMVIEAFREEVAKEGSPLQIARINISHQPIFGLIAPIDDFGLIGETLQRRHRTKNSSLMHRAHWLAPFWRLEILNHPDVNVNSVGGTVGSTALMEAVYSCFHCPPTKVQDHLSILHALLAHKDIDVNKVKYLQNKNLHQAQH